MTPTVEDFWRMVTEHSIKTLVQLTADDEEYAWPYYPEKLSSNGNGPNFAEYGAMRVSLDAREDLASYVRRDFTVYNSKADDTVKLTHFSYGGWNKSHGKPSSPSSQTDDKGKVVIQKTITFQAGFKSLYLLPSKFNYERFSLCRAKKFHSF